MLVENVCKQKNIHIKKSIQAQAEQTEKIKQTVPITVQNVHSARHVLIFGNAIYHNNEY